MKSKNMIYRDDTTADRHQTSPSKAAVSTQKYRNEFHFVVLSMCKHCKSHTKILMLNL